MRQTALSRGFAIHYEDSGGPGPPLVLVNGYASPAREWAERGYVAELVGRFRVFAVDSLGHGESDCPHEPDAYLYPDVAEDIIAVLDHADLGHATLWGYSRGARLVATAAAEHPDRVDALILGGFSHLDGEVSDEVDPTTDALLRGDWQAFWDTLEMPVSEEDRRYMEEASDPQAMAAVSVGLARSGYAIPLDRIAAPVLLYYGAGDADEIAPLGEALNVTPTVLDGNHSHTEAFNDAPTVLAYVNAFLERTHA